MPTTDDHMLADLRLQAESMTATAALPRRDDAEPVFDEPWQGRAVAVAIEVVAALDLSWDHFRRRLVAAIDDGPHRPYYESWLVALDDLVAAYGLATTDDIDAHRVAAAAYRTSEHEHDDLEVFPIPDHVSMTSHAHAELQRQWVDGKPARWMMRTYDDHGEVVSTVDLPPGEWFAARERLLDLPPDVA